MTGTSPGNSGTTPPSRRASTKVLAIRVVLSFVFGRAAKNPSCHVILFCRTVWETGVIDKRARSPPGFDDANAGCSTGFLGAVRNVAG
ncbi:hypothetical protein SPHINGO391_350539 [Sphingomonas aurantiaca]|uniref:Uncharacterized protein n=1 Tax=Sphingomonas aurantiaca TaxID=185949 RepID=A0A5E7YGV7_9SPHN|nr:hypothetical protein SPHINGO391_350539 [Sphingomonas aurantiaca]